MHSNQRAPAPVRRQFRRPLRPQSTAPAASGSKQRPADPAHLLALRRHGARCMSRSAPAFSDGQLGMLLNEAREGARTRPDAAACRKLEQPEPAPRHWEQETGSGGPPNAMSPNASFRFLSKSRSSAATIRAVGAVPVESRSQTFLELRGCGCRVPSFRSPDPGNTRRLRSQAALKTEPGPSSDGSSAIAADAEAGGARPARQPG